MKIEKISENQIRCTLDSSDLTDRHINLGELAYGSEKAKELFREMMQQAFNDFGFDVEDNPLMVEAIPMSGEGIVLLITKVEDPEELDTRFSKFSPVMEEEKAPDTELYPTLEGAEVLKNQEPSEKEEKPAEGKSSRIFEFDSMDTITAAAEIICPIYDGLNSLYRDPDSGRYYLTVSGQGYATEVFARVLNMLSEFASLSRLGYARGAYMEEHFELIIDGMALQVLQNL